MTFRVSAPETTCRIARLSRPCFANCPRGPAACAAVLGYSGALLGGETLSAEAKARPPVMLVHGEADPMVPSARMAQAKASLEAVDFKVETHLRPGLGHGIDTEGLALGGRFLAEALANA